jgi:hypothetical protein
MPFMAGRTSRADVGQAVLRYTFAVLAAILTCLGGILDLFRHLIRSMPMLGDGLSVCMSHRWYAHLNNIYLVK